MNVFAMAQPCASVAIHGVPVALQLAPEDVRQGVEAVPRRGPPGRDGHHLEVRHHDEAPDVPRAGEGHGLDEVQLSRSAELRNFAAELCRGFIPFGFFKVKDNHFTLSKPASSGQATLPIFSEIQKFYKF